MVPIHNYFVLNGSIVPVSEFQQEETTGSIYEVLRIIRGVPLFLSDHLQRLAHSAELANVSFSWCENQIEELLFQLIKVNQVVEGNILIAFKENLKAFFIPHNYPGFALYENGIRLGLLHAERTIPNAKVLQTEVRQMANEMMLNHDFYEVLLVDQSGKITEGSKSNVFFVKNNMLVTPPDSEILLGITREKTLKLAEYNDFLIEQRSILIDELPTFDAAFITGTSPKILPAKQVGDQPFNPGNPMVIQLIKAYDKLIDEYISAR